MSDMISKERTHNYLRQIKGTAIYKAFAMVASFLAIPLMISYLGQEMFGVWSTLLTIMAWIVFFDIGLGNGLRNKVAEALAKNEIREAGKYIASGYTLIGLVAFTVCVLVNVGSYFVSWQIIFNTQATPESTLREAVQIATFFIALNFWIGLITALLGAVQKTSLVARGQLISNLLILVLVVVLTKTTNSSISHLALAYGLSLVIANVSLSLWFYRKHPELKPRLLLEKRHVQPLLSVGLSFFIIQLAVLLIFTTDKILITQLFGPLYVTQYEIVFKLFSSITFAHGMVSMPLWSAYTDAFHRNDFGWIKNMLRKQLKIFGCVIVAACLLTWLAEPIISVWIGPNLVVSSHLILAMAIFVVISCWNNIYAMFVNGIGQIKLQLYTAIVAMFINIPLSIYFAKHTELGLSGIVAGTICSLLLAAIALPLQVYYLISRPLNTPSDHMKIGADV
jgi:O-antigen/teichoic acid export membrane protein